MRDIFLAFGKNILFPDSIPVSETQYFINNWLTLF